MIKESSTQTSLTIFGEMTELIDNSKLAIIHNKMVFRKKNKNQPMVEMTRCMLKEKNLPDIFWVEEI